MVENRIKLRAPHTRGAVVRLLNRLDDLSEGSRQKKLDMLDEAIVNGWKSVYDHRNRDAPAESSGGWANDPEVMT